MMFSWEHFWGFLGFIWGIIAVGGFVFAVGFVVLWVVERYVSDTTAKVITGVAFLIAGTVAAAVFIGVSMRNWL